MHHTTPLLATLVVALALAFALGLAARLLRVPERSGSATLGWTGTRLSGALTLRGEGDQDDAGGVRAGFVTANLNGSWALSEAVTLTVRFENLADRRYQQVLGYGEPGRSGFVGIRLRY
jgi:vitamin B12 transporter